MDTAFRFYPNSTEILSLVLYELKKSVLPDAPSAVQTVGGIFIKNKATY